MEDSTKKSQTLKITPEEMFNVFIECSVANAPVKQILERYQLKPWNLVEIRKKIKEASLEALACKGKRKGRKQFVTLDKFQTVSRELEQAKDALTAVGHELALLKKKVN